jgi:hypothetical protein
MDYCVANAATMGHTVEWARKHIVGRGYFETAQNPILAGRGFRREDEASGARNVIVSEELVRVLWKGQDPLGRQIELSNGQPAAAIGAMPGTIDYRAGSLGSGRQMYEIVGVAPSLRGVTLMLRAAAGVDAIAAVRREVAAMDSTITPFNARSMAEQIAQFMSMFKAASWTYGLIGVFGLILDSVGLAGVTAYSVTQRGHEIGIRLALGAQRRDVLGLVMKEVAFNSPLLLVGAPLLLAGLALAACYLPARRSTRMDPVVALRQE